MSGANGFGTKQRPLGRPRQNKNTKSTKETILEVATRLFLTQNYQVVSMGEVAKFVVLRKQPSTITIQQKPIYLPLL